MKFPPTPIGHVVCRGLKDIYGLCSVILGMGREWDTFLRLPPLLNL